MITLKSIEFAKGFLMRKWHIEFSCGINSWRKNISNAMLVIWLVLHNRGWQDAMIHKRKKRLSCFSSLSAWKFKPFFQKYEWLGSSNRAAKTLRNHQRIRSQIIMFESSRNLSGRIKCSTSRFTGHSKYFIWVIVTKLHKWVSIKTRETNESQ